MIQCEGQSNTGTVVLFVEDLCYISLSDHPPQPSACFSVWP